MAGLGKTAWVDRALATYWDALGAAVPPEWRPRATIGKRGKVVAEEYGCGHYGCVMPTSIPGLVVKLTTDATEAAFVAIAMQLGQDEDSGLVLYRGIYALPGAVHRERQVYVLWREEAAVVGDELYTWWHQRYRDDAYMLSSFAELTRFLGLYKELAGKARDLITQNPAFLVEARIHEDWARDLVMEIDWSRRPPMHAHHHPLYAVSTPRPKRLAGLLRACAMLAEWMENTYLCDAIGRMFTYYQEQGLLLADVHTGNIGLVRRVGTTPVITDPGHAVLLDPRWAQVGVPTLPGA